MLQFVGKAIVFSVVFVVVVTIIYASVWAVFVGSIIHIFGS